MTGEFWKTLNPHLLLYYAFHLPYLITSDVYVFFCSFCIHLRLISYYELFQICLHRNHLYLCLSVFYSEIYFEMYLSVLYSVMYFEMYLSVLYSEMYFEMCLSVLHSEMYFEMRLSILYSEMYFDLCKCLWLFSSVFRPLLQVNKPSWG